jgi:hypothetical protein
MPKEKIKVYPLNQRGVKKTRREYSGTVSMVCRLPYFASFNNPETAPESFSGGIPKNIGNLYGRRK